MPSRLNVVMIIASFAYSGSALAKDCNPPRVMCGNDPYSYACPPCGPATFSSTEEAENYRQSLEEYREKIESEQSEGKIPHAAYSEALEDYQSGIQRYQTAAAAAQSHHPAAAAPATSETSHDFMADPATSPRIESPSGPEGNQ